jgi:hypothetical protein
MRPADFARSLVAAVQASDGRRRRRKRDTEPDRIGLDIKRDLLAGTAAEDPDPEQFEGFLLGRALAAEASGPVRAICLEILDEYLLARADSAFASWLANGGDGSAAGPRTLSDRDRDVDWLGLLSADEGAQEIRQPLDSGLQRASSSLVISTLPRIESPRLVTFRWRFLAYPGYGLR